MLAAFIFFVEKYNDKDGKLLSIEEIVTNGIGHCALAKLFLDKRLIS